MIESDDREYFGVVGQLTTDKLPAEWRALNGSDFGADHVSGSALAAGVCTKNVALVLLEASTQCHRLCCFLP